MTTRTLSVSMWQIAVLIRFEALQNFLSVEERHLVKSALLEDRKKSIDAKINAEVACSGIESGGSAHLERYKNIIS